MLIRFATVNVLDVLRKNKIGDALYLPLDHHWSPRGAAVVAQAVADQMPDDVKRQVYTSEYAVTAGPEKTEWVTAFSTKLTALCPGLEWPRQSIATVKLNDPAPTLLGDEPEHVVLLGSSFSNPNSGNGLNFGFDSFLAHSLGARVTNHALNGGDLVQAALLYFASDHTTPNVMIWEFYVSALSNPAQQILEFRQLLPTLYSSSGDTTVLARPFEGGKSLVVDVGKALDNVGENQNVYMEFTSSELPRTLTVKIDYRDGTTQTVPIERKFFLFPIPFSNFKLELESPGIKQISLSTSGESVIKGGELVLKTH